MRKLFVLGVVVAVALLLGLTRAALPQAEAGADALPPSVTACFDGYCDGVFLDLNTTAGTVTGRHIGSCIPSSTHNGTIKFYVVPDRGIGASTSNPDHSGSPGFNLHWRFNLTLKTWAIYYQDTGALLNSGTMTYVAPGTDCSVLDGAGMTAASK
jgi:hypothetical protein